MLLLPYLEERQLYADYDFDEPWDGPNNSKLAGRRPRVYRLHGIDDPGGTVTNYLAVIGSGTVWEPGNRVSYESLGNNSGSTISVVENVGSGISWLEPRDLQLDQMSFTLKDDPANGISSWLQPPAVAMAGGQVVTLDMNLTPAELRDMLKIDGKAGLPGGAKPIEDGRNRPLRTKTRD